MPSNQNAILRPLIDEYDIKIRVGNLVHEIARDFHGEELVVVGILKGSFMFLADLVRLLHLHGIQLIIDFMIVSSYGSGTESSGRMNMSRDITTDIKDKAVLIVDDILDTGRTSNFVKEHIIQKKPRVLKTCVFLDKPDRRVVPFQPDYIGFKIPDAFVVGYGLDCDSRYRELPYLSIISFDEKEPKSRFAFRIQNNMIILEGRLDATATNQIKHTLLYWQGDLNLNMENLAYISSSGLGLLLTVLKEIKKSGHEMRLLGLQPDVREVFVMGGFDMMFKI